MVRRSLWEDIHPRRPLDPAAPSGTPTGHHDVVVVGGGLSGLTTALLLARAGRSVQVLEARQVGSGTTGRSTAKVSLLQGTRLSRIARRHTMSTVRHYVTGNRAAQDWLHAFAEQHGVPVQVRPAYTYAHGRSGERRARREHEVARQAGLPTRWLDEVPLPYPTAGSVRLDDQLQVDPLALVDALVAEARGLGVQVLEGVRVRRVHGRQPTRVITTDDAVVTADAVVLATGMPILDRGGWFARMKPARSYGLAFRTPAPAVDGMYLSADLPSRSLRDAETGQGPLLLVGGEGHVTGRGGDTAQRLDRLREWTAQHFPQTEETHAWSAQDFEPAHQLPVAGPLMPGSDDLLVAGGYSKWGLTNGVAAAHVVTGHLLGSRPEWADAYAPWSRKELAGLPQDALFNAEVGVHMATGWATKGERPVCTHLGGVTSWNDAEQSWDCPLHGSRFTAEGEVLDGPATCRLRAAAARRS